MMPKVEWKRGNFDTKIIELLQVDIVLPDESNTETIGPSVLSSLEALLHLQRLIFVK